MRLWWVCLLLPAGSIPWWHEHVGDRVARGVARGLSVLSDLNGPATSRETKLIEPEVILREVVPNADPEAEKGRGRGTVESAAPQVSSLRVSQDTVLELAERRARPRGVFIEGGDGRPSGLALYGVSELGVGLRDGDVLTHVAGQPVSSESQVVSLVLSSRGARRPRIAGRIWRRGRGYSRLVVEQPYLNAFDP